MTKQEKLVILFLIGLLVLGLAVKFYKAHSGVPVLKVEKIDIDKIEKETRSIRINTATAGDFARLPGIGPALAGRIVDYRAKFGAFSAKQDIKNVSGIGEKKYEAIKDLLTFD